MVDKAGLDRKYKTRDHSNQPKTLYEKVLSSGKAIVLAGNCAIAQNGV